MMPLTLADTNISQIIKKIGGSPQVKSHLADLGFVVGGDVTVVSSVSGNLIVKVKESRIAIGEDMAMKIFV
ncbi:MAG: ferrous iron transport protein A [Acetobacter sp.]|nr:ferrous iron transport protein A [Bacteroides sp.]MCM1341070.1 ferrous iron transport protein A [Acetobacter sp.]MCM1433597.1 ferrous iron transport protein A [Clostridiales bacterium]